MCMIVCVCVHVCVCMTSTTSTTQKPGSHINYREWGGREYKTGGGFMLKGGAQ